MPLAPQLRSFVVVEYALRRTRPATCLVKVTSLDLAHRGHLIGRTNRDIGAAFCAVGNTGVTEMGVVERGGLQRDEAREDQLDSRNKVFRL
jgi:hypothetical protein